jgi:hypothetical protein
MKWVKISLVVFGALVVTALGIDASDTLKGASGTLLSQVVGSTDGCPSGMVSVPEIPTMRCVDQYEAAAGDSCPERDPSTTLASYKNTETAGCASVSVVGKVPWRYVTRDQAMMMCARSGKRLPTNSEWHSLVLGMSEVEKSCNVTTGAVSTTGSFAGCVSPASVFDLVGNTWEWVSDDVIEGTYSNRQLPESGYVHQVDTSGIATVTGDSGDALYGKDYFWSEPSGAYGIIRGGYYDSGEDAGLYTVHADTSPNGGSAGIGFRCVL